jgi:hypothetical protein
MQILLEVPDELAAEAQSRGVSLESYVKEIVETARKPKAEIQWNRFGPGPYTPQEAGRNIRELSKRITLGGDVTLKKLIDEGRKY